MKLMGLILLGFLSHHASATVVSRLLEDGVKIEQLYYNEVRFKHDQKSDKDYVRLESKILGLQSAEQSEQVRLIKEKMKGEKPKAIRDAFTRQKAARHEEKRRKYDNIAQKTLAFATCLDHTNFTVVFLKDEEKIKLQTITFGQNDFTNGSHGAYKYVEITADSWLWDYLEYIPTKPCIPTPEEKAFIRKFKARMRARQQKAKALAKDLQILLPGWAEARDNSGNPILPSSVGLEGEVLYRLYPIDQFTGRPDVKQPHYEETTEMPIQTDAPYTDLSQKGDFLKKPRRRLANQDLIDRFIRESIRCIES